MKKGKFIVIDGTDGSGKATQTKLLLEHLSNSGRKATKIDFPRYDTNFMGGFLAECLGKKPGVVMPVDAQAFLALDPRIASTIYALDRMESADFIRGQLESGVTVVGDRYASSNQIHQGGKIRDENVRTAFMKWLDRLEFEVCKIPRPDVIVYLHVPVEVSMKLARDRAIQKNESPDVAENDAKHQAESQESALSIIKSSNNWLRVDCAPNGTLLSPAEIHERVWRALESILV